MLSLVAYPLLLITGLIVGLYGSTAGGASLVSLPVLVLLGLPTTLALGTNRFSIVFLELTGAARFYQKQSTTIKWRTGLLLASGSVIGSLIGANLVLQVPTKYLDIVVGATLLFVLILIFRQKDFTQPLVARQPHPIIMFFLAMALGVYLGFVGAGAFGILLTMALLWQGYTFIQSAALSRLIGFCTSAVAAIVFISNHLVNYPAAIALGIGCIGGAWFGPSIALKRGEPFIRKLFIVIAVITAIKLIYQAIF